MLSKYQSRYEARYSIRYRIPKSGPELRSLDQLIELKLRTRSLQRSLDTKVELKSRRLRTRITPKPVPRSLTEEGSVRGRSLQSSSSTGSTKTRISYSLFVETNRPGFSVNIFSQITGNEVLISYSDVIGRLD